MSPSTATAGMAATVSSVQRPTMTAATSASATMTAPVARTERRLDRPATGKSPRAAVTPYPFPDRTACLLDRPACRSAAVPPSDRPRRAAQPLRRGPGITTRTMTAKTTRASGPRISSEAHDGVVASPRRRPSTRTTATMPSAPSIGSPTEQPSAAGRSETWRMINRPLIAATRLATTAWSRATTVMPQWTVAIRTAVRTARCRPRTKKTRSARPTALRRSRALRIRERKSPYAARNLMAPVAGAHLWPSSAISPANSTRPANQGVLSAVISEKAPSAVRACASREGSRQ